MHSTKAIANTFVALMGLLREDGLYIIEGTARCKLLTLNCTPAFYTYGTNVDAAYLTETLVAHTTNRTHKHRLAAQMDAQVQWRSSCESSGGGGRAGGARPYSRVQERPALYRGHDPHQRSKFRTWIQHDVTSVLPRRTDLFTVPQPIFTVRTLVPTLVHIFTVALAGRKRETKWREAAGAA